jgi:CheY-like chemotaxis protein
VIRVQQEGAGPAPSPAARCSILVVEDNDRSRRLIGHVLRGQGLRVTAVATGEEGVAAAKAEPPDLMLVDIQLAGSRLDGERVLELIRADPATARTVVIALTAYAVRGDRERFLAAGFDGYVAKPIDVRTIVPTLLAHLPSAP